MGKINILDSSVYNVIAAGEVVERPASIVKELIENSIDAGATSIVVEIENGGIDTIRVTDNGCGIEPDDIPKAFLAHATSKIKTAGDLDGIGTLGFRGEALASIAAVSDVSLSSRIAQNELGYTIRLENGKVVDEGVAGCPLGTTITVKDVFARIPARRKFLSKPKSEEAEISNIVTRFILADYNISIKYTADFKTVLWSSGKDIESAIYTVYGKEFSENITKVDYTLSDITLKGYVCKPYYTKHSRNFQTLIVNGRYVINPDVSYQIYDCYQNFLMKRQYPAYVLYLNLPLDMVDVNVHPNKLDVKFAAPQLIKRIVRDAVSQALGSNTHEVKAITVEEPHKVPLNDKFVTITPQDEDGLSAVGSHEQFRSRRSLIIENLSAGGSFLQDSLQDSGKFRYEPEPESKGSFLQPDAAGKSPSDIDADLKRRPHAQSVSDQISLELFGSPSYKIRGVLFDTYVLLESGQNVYIIDQHAAHEKLLYDKLTAAVEKGVAAAQRLLLPYDFEVSFSDGVTIKENSALFAACGFEIAQKSDTSFTLCSVPSLCSGLKIKDFLGLLLSDMEKSHGKADFIKDSLMQAACKAAVKGEDKLSDSELQILINDIIKEDITLYCPHGRPVAVRVTKTELEKWFKRTV